MKWGGGAFAIIEPFAIWGLSQKREVTHSYLVARTLHCGPPCSRDTAVKCDARGR